MVKRICSEATWELRGSARGDTLGLQRVPEDLRDLCPRVYLRVQAPEQFVGARTKLYPAFLWLRSPFFSRPWVPRDLVVKERDGVGAEGG